MKPNYILPIAALAIAVLIWGIVPSLIRALTLETGPADSVVIRMFTNAIFCLPLMFFAGWHIERQDWPRLLVLACICNFGYYVGSIYAFANLSAGAGGMLYATNPMMIVGLAIAVGQERLSLAVIMGMVISFIGTLVLFSGGLVGAGGNPLFGGLVMLAACFGWALYVVFNRPLVKKYGPMRITLYSIMLPAIPALLFLTPHTYTTFTNLTPDAIIALVTMTLFGTILSVNLWNYASQYLPSSSCGASLYLIPPGAAVFGWLFLHETTGPQTLLGGLIILIGVAVAEFGKKLYDRTHEGHMNSASTKPTPWYFDPMTLLVAGCLVAIINFGLRSTFGLFTLPISTAHQWPREVYSWAVAIQNLVWGIGTPIAGMLADRYGSARVLMAGAVIYALGLIGINYSNTGLMLDLTAGLLVGFGVAFSSFSIVMAALGRLVPPEKRSWAFGLATASGSLGQALFIWPVGQTISSFGWNNALVAMAIAALIIIPLAAPLLIQNTSKAKVMKGETALSMGKAIAEAFSHPSYLLLFTGFFVCGFQLAFITVHFPPYLAEHGISKEVGLLAMMLIGLFNVVGAYTSGIIGKGKVKRVPLAAIYFARAAIYTIYILTPISTTSTLIFAAGIGLLWLSTIPLTMGLITVMFGTRYMATLYGFVFLSHQIGSFLGVWLGGKLYDIYGSYDVVWWMSVALGVFAGLIHLPIREIRARAFAVA